MPSTDPQQPDALDTDAVSVRTLGQADLDDIVRIDEHVTGGNRRQYYELKVAAALQESGVKISLVAELDGAVVGFLMGALFHGEFGLMEPVAVLDTLGVHPDFRGRHVGAALMQQLEKNLGALNIDRIETQVDWNQEDLLRFLRGRGFSPIPRLCLARSLD